MTIHLPISGKPYGVRGTTTKGASSKHAIKVPNIFYSRLFISELKEKKIDDQKIMHLTLLSEDHRLISDVQVRPCFYGPALAKYFPTQLNNVDLAEIPEGSRLLISLARIQGDDVCTVARARLYSENRMPIISVQFMDRNSTPEQLFPPGFGDDTPLLWRFGCKRSPYIGHELREHALEMEWKATWSPYCLVDMLPSKWWSEEGLMILAAMRDFCSPLGLSKSMGYAFQSIKNDQAIWTGLWVLSPQQYLPNISEAEARFLELPPAVIKGCRDFFTDPAGTGPERPQGSPMGSGPKSHTR